MVTVLGIDPGTTGAVARLVQTSRGVTLDVWDLPSVEVGKGRKRLSGHLLAEMLRREVLGTPVGPVAPQICLLEQVGAMPKQGLSSTFNFGVAVGTIEGVLAACEVPYQHIRPAEWKRKVGLASRDKDEARTRVLQLYPDRAELFRRKCDHNRAEAALLAHVALGWRS